MSQKENHNTTDCMYVCTFVEQVNGKERKRGDEDER